MKLGRVRIWAARAQEFTVRSVRFLRRSIRPLLIAGCDAIDPTLALVSSRVRPVRARLVSVYRHDNAPRIAVLVEEAVRDGWSVSLWALDDIHPQLEAHTVGRGPGQRFSLLNKLLPTQSNDEYLVVCDDDIVVTRGSLRLAVETAALFTLDLAGISHDTGSARSHQFTDARPFAVARLTNFVEIGPSLIISPSARPRMTPFPESGMGWGTELDWSDLLCAGFVLAIIDVVRLRHLDPVGIRYDRAPERARLQRMFADRGISSWSDWQTTFATLRLWSSARTVERTRARS